MGEVSCNYRVIGSDIDGLKEDEELGRSISLSFNGDTLDIGGTWLFICIIMMQIMMSVSCSRTR